MGATRRGPAAARDGIVPRGKAHTGEKTMVDAWTPAVEAAVAAADSGATPAGPGGGRGGDRGRGGGHRPMIARRVAPATSASAPSGTGIRGAVSTALIRAPPAGAAE